MSSVGVSRALVNAVRRRSVFALRGGKHELPPPPFARLPAPTQRLPEEYELIWQDSVAPELVIDFDAQHFSRAQGLALWFAGLGFFASVLGLAWLSNPSAKRAADPRINGLDLDYEMGLAPSAVEE